MNGENTTANSVYTHRIILIVQCSVTSEPRRPTEKAPWMSAADRAWRWRAPSAPRSWWWARRDWRLRRRCAARWSRSAGAGGAGAACAPRRPRRRCCPTWTPRRRAPSPVVARPRFRPQTTSRAPPPQSPRRRSRRPGPTRPTRPTSDCTTLC